MPKNTVIRTLLLWAAFSLCLMRDALAVSPVNLTNWYWITTESHGGNTVFSLATNSGNGGYVASNDAGYLAWVAAGNTAQTLHDGQLAVILSGFNLNAATLAANPTVWTGVSGVVEVQTAFSGGCALTYTGVSALNATYETSGISYSYLTNDLLNFALIANAFPNGAGTVVYSARSGNVTFDTVAHMEGVIKGLINYRAAWLDWLRAGGSPPAWATCSTS